MTIAFCVIRERKEPLQLSTFQDILLSVLNKLAHIEKKICLYNRNTFMNKSLRKAIMIKGTVIQIEKTLINDHLGVSTVS